MKKGPWYIIAFILLIIIFFSCQKEFSIEGLNTDENVLGRSVTGECLPIKVSGIFFTGKELGDTNFIEVQVLVKTKGAYAISTETINGYSFQAKGTFADTGIVQVQLKGTGKPIAAGADNFTVSLGTTNCSVTINVQTPSQGAASYTLEGDPSTCLNANIEGVFMKNIKLDTTNKIKIKVNVVTTGSYAISTNLVNGYSFSDSGFFTTNGVQAVTLKSTGKPLAEGIDQFTLAGNVSACSLSIPVTSGYVAVFNNDYFPLTYQSNWSYTDLWNTGFSVKRVVTDSVMMNGLLYKITSEQNTPAGDNQQFYRKSGSDYYEYISVDKYTSSLKFTTQINKDLLFLKENSITGTAWESPADTGQIIGGQRVVLKYTFRCVAANISETIERKSYKNVLIIQVRPQVRSLTDPWGETGEITDLHFAKGVGLINARKITNSFTTLHWELNSYLIK